VCCGSSHMQPPPAPTGEAARVEVAQLQEALAAKQQVVASTEAELAASKAKGEKLNSMVGGLWWVMVGGVGVISLGRGEGRAKIATLCPRAVHPA